jgi:hypothetical protein
MPIEIKFNKSVQNLLNKTSKAGLIPKVRFEFNKKGPVKVKQAIIQDIIIGTSPVKGKGKWKRYSKSYKEQIEGKSAFRSNGKGGVKKYSTVGLSGKAKKDMQKTIDKLNKDFKNKQKPTKRISPVNLRLSGGLHRSLFSKTTGGVTSAYKLIIGFADKLADIHNRQGAGKSKVKRRLLPTKSGEQFNRRITSTMLTELKKAAAKVVNQLNGQ